MRSRPGPAGTSLLVGALTAGSVGQVGDAELLDRVVAAGGVEAELAVAALVERHAAMVWRVCRTASAGEADAADAFQATFLILLRRAGSIRRRESVAGWLGGVARRVARQSRANAARRRDREAIAAARVGTWSRPAADPTLGELPAIVRDELGRLSDRERDVVLACDLDGLTETEAARRLDCPVGTVRSRLHRARVRLRRRFAARGLDPTAALALLPTFEVGKLPAGLILGTIALAVEAGLPVARWSAPVAVALLVKQSTRSVLMFSLVSTGTALVALIGSVSGLIPGPGSALEATSPRLQDPPPAATTASPVSLGPAERKTAAMADEYRKLAFEYELGMYKANSAAKAGKTQFEENEIRSKLRPDENAYARRMIDLALLDPKSKPARDAAIWVMDMPWRTDAGAFQGEYEAAVNMLIHFHADDPEVIRVGLQLDGVIGRRRDAFLEGCYANATSHESRGLARLAYAQYLERKVPWVRSARKSSARNVIEFEKSDPNDKRVSVSMAEPNTDFAYRVGLRWIDPDAMQAEVDRLYGEVIADYADVPYITRHRRNLEARLANPVVPDGPQLTDAERATIRNILNERTTLGAVAKERLAKMKAQATGQPAPEINGVDVATGRPFRLADYRGKVVLVLFWAENAGASFLEQIEKRWRAEQAHGRPFVVLGVVYADDEDAARKLVREKQSPWVNTFEGKGDDLGPIGEAYFIKTLNQGILIDADGKVARAQIRGTDWESRLDDLLARTKPAGR